MRILSRIPANRPQTLQVQLFARQGKEHHQLRHHKFGWDPDLTSNPKINIVVSILVLFLGIEVSIYGS